MTDATNTTLKLMQSKAYRGWVLTLFLLIAMFGFVDRQVISALGQPIKLELGLSDAQLGLLGGLVFALLNSLLTIPIARVAETRRRVTIISIGVFMWSAATALCGLAQGFGQLVIARLCVGVGEATGGPATSSLLADYFARDRRASASAVYVLAVPLGALIGAAGGGYIAQHANWRMAFVAAGIPGVVLGLLLALTVREPIRGHYDAPGVAGEGAPPLTAVIRRMFDRPAFLHVMIGSTVASMGGFGINYFLAPYFFRRFGLDFAQGGLLSGLISAIPGSISMLHQAGDHQHGRGRDPRFYAWVPAIGAFLATPLYAISFLQGGWVAATTMLMITGLVQYAYLPASVAVSANIMAPRMRASAAAIVGIMTNLVGAGLGPLLVGTLSDLFAKHAFGPGFATACAGVKAAQTTSAGACGQASATGLEWACIIAAVVYLWAAVHFVLAARTLKRDMSEGVPVD